jgi:hypothetical protein
MRIDSAPKPAWRALAATIGVVLAAMTAGLTPDRALYGGLRGRSGTKNSGA